jgi:hypothetical protein
LFQEFPAVCHDNGIFLWFVRDTLNLGNAPREREYGSCKKVVFD